MIIMGDSESGGASRGFVSRVKGKSGRERNINRQPSKVPEEHMKAPVNSNVPHLSQQFPL